MQALTNPMRRCVRIIGAAFLAILFASCRDGGPMLSDDARIAASSPAELDAIERDAIAKLLARTPEGAGREAMREFLANPPITFEVKDTDKDPEGVRLLKIVAAARDARGRARGTGANLSSVPSTPGTVVQIAMVKRLTGADASARAVIRREPGDNGRPLLILPQSATAGDMDRALSAAVDIVRREGKDPTRVTVFRLSKSPSKRQASKERGKDILAHVHSAPEKQHPELGTIKFTLVSVR